MRRVEKRRLGDEFEDEFEDEQANENRRSGFAGYRYPARRTKCGVTPQLVLELGVILEPTPLLGEGLYT